MAKLKLSQKELARMLEYAKNQMAICDNHYDSVIRDAVLERLKIYYSDKKRYEKKFKRLSEKTDYVNHDMWSVVEFIRPMILDSFLGSASILHIRPHGPEDDRVAETQRK